MSRSVRVCVHKYGWWCVVECVSMECILTHNNTRAYIFYSFASVFYCARDRCSMYVCVGWRTHESTLERAACAGPVTSCSLDKRRALCLRALLDLLEKYRKLAAVVAASVCVCVFVRAVRACLCVACGLFAHCVRFFGCAVTLTLISCIIAGVR